MSKLLDSCTSYELLEFSRGVRLPEIKITDAQKEELMLPISCSNTEYLKKCAWSGCLNLIKNGKIKQSREDCILRLKIEFDVFEKTGTIDYILLLMDVFLWCEKNDIARGVARGSAGASMVLFCVGLNYINPLDFDLNFTRFLSEARVKPKIVDGVMYGDGKSMCDVDIDVQFTGRELLIKRLETDYEGKTCKILTLQELTGKMAMKEAVKAYLEYDESKAMVIGGYFEAMFGKMDSIEKTYEKSKDFREWVDSEPRHKECYTIALQLENLRKCTGTHASGIALSYKKFDELLPKEISNSGEVVSSMSMNDVLKVAVKCDVLGLRTLDQVKIACDAAKIKMLDIDIYHPSIYKYLRESTSFTGLFQVESGLTKEAVIKVKPETFAHIIAIISISRPGSYKEIDRLVKYVATGERKLVHPEIDKILEDSGSILIYQEQINSICQKVYGLIPTDADHVRRAVGKKDRDEMKKWEVILAEQGVKLGVPDDITKWFLQVCHDSADYLFPKSHGAAYSYLTAYTTYLKANYPLEFFLGCLKMAQHDSNPVEIYNKVQGEMRDMGLKLLPPNIVKSEVDYAIKDNCILTGLSAIKGVAGKGLLKLEQYNRKNSNIFQIFEHFEQAKLSLSVVTPLILCGTMQDDSQTERSKLLLYYELYCLLTPKERILAQKIGSDYQFDLISLVNAANATLKDEKGKPYIKDSRKETIKRDFTPYWEKYKRNQQFSELSDWIFEQTYIGYSFSSTLKQIYSKTISNLKDTKEIGSLKENSKVVTVGIIRELEKRVSKKGTPYIKVTLADDLGSVTAMIFMEDKITAMDSQNGGPLKENDIVVAHMIKKDGNSYFADNFVRQTCPVVLKKSTIEKEIAAKENKEG